jgi:signal transduction histidine kinase
MAIWADSSSVHQVREPAVVAKAAPAAPLAKVLITDDDERNIRLLDAILRAAGYQTVPAKSGQECLDRLADSKPDLILLDVMMPGLSGLDVCRRIKEDAATREIPVVMVTALADRKDHERAVEAGADDFVTKPVDKGVLLLRLRSLLRAKRYADENRQLAKIQEDFVGMVVHDLANPLGIVSFALDEVLGSEMSPNEREQALRDARDASEEAAQLVRDLIALVKLERSRMEPRPEVVDAVQLAQDVVRTQRRASGSVQTVVSAGALPPIWADRSLTRRVLVNLIENAVRHSPAGATVVVSLAERSGALEISVVDQGAGIPPELHQSIFEKFRQIESSSNARVGKLGLGLAFCKLAVESQGGSIVVESSGRGDGAVFRFTLPIAGSTS